MVLFKARHSCTKVLLLLSAVRSGGIMQRQILPGIDLAYPQSQIKDKDVFPHITGGRCLVFQGNLGMDLRAVDQTQMYPFLK